MVVKNGRVINDELVTTTMDQLNKDTSRPTTYGPEKYQEQAREHETNPLMNMNQFMMGPQV